MSRYCTRNVPRLSQGDLFGGVRIVEGEFPEGLKETEFGYSILLSQDCDLEQDWRATVARNEQDTSDVEDRRKKEDKVLRHVILAPCYVEEAFKEGQHVDGREMKTWNSTEMQKIIRPNKHIRYHYLPSEAGILEQSLVVDFKHYFSVERDQFYEHSKRSGRFPYVCSVAILYRDALSKRFGDYLSRIGFPDEDETIPGRRRQAATAQEGASPPHPASATSSEP